VPAVGGSPGAGAGCARAFADRGATGPRLACPDGQVGRCRPGATWASAFASAGCPSGNLPANDAESAGRFHRLLQSFLTLGRMVSLRPSGRFSGIRLSSPNAPRGSPISVKKSALICVY